MIKKIFTLLCLCTLCIGSAWGDYVKVTSAPTDWSGEYLLVYDNGENSVAWTGVDAQSCNVSVTIDNGKISEKPNKAVTITIAPMTGGYSIKVNGGDNNGKFIKGTSNSNALGFETTAQLNTISYDATNKGVLITSNTSVMRYNPSDKNYRFRYFKSASYSSQKIVQLYKYENGDTPSKTLTSIAISGTPKTTYEIGESFDVTGLTVTGTYEDASTADLTSSAEWSINPETFTSTSQNSVEVTATVDNITSEAYVVDGLTVTAAQKWAKVTAAKTDWSGEYLLVYENNSTAYVWTGVDAASCNATATISNNQITKPTGAVSLTIASMDGGYSIFVNGGDNNGKYISGKSGSNTVNFGTDASANTLAYSEGNVTITSNTSTIMYNSSSSDNRFRYYKSGSSQKAVQLYEKVLAPTNEAVTFAAPEGGSLVIKNGETPIASGATIQNGTVLNVEFRMTPADAYKDVAIKVTKTDGGDDVTSTVYDATEKQITMPRYAITVAVTSTKLYKISLEIAGQGTGSATMNGVTTDIYVDDDTQINLVATPIGFSEFISWSATENITINEVSEAETYAYASGDGTITATFGVSTLLPLDYPTLSDPTNITYSSVTLNWEELANAKSYNVELLLNDETVASDVITGATSWTPEVTLQANTTYTYTVQGVGDGITYAINNNPKAQSTVTTADYPATTLTLSENGITRDIAGKLNMPIDLPTTSTQTYEGKVFMGWSETIIDGVTDTKPSLLGETYTFTDPEKLTATIYAVYAKETPGEAANWEITSLDKPGTGTGYAPYNGSHTTDNISYTTSQIMMGTGENANKMQFQKNAGMMYNTTPFSGDILFITIADITSNISVYEGSTEIATTPTSGAITLADGKYTFSKGKKYFHIKMGNATGYSSKITVAVAGAPTYSNYCTSVPRTFKVNVSSSAATGLTTMYVDYATEIPKNAEAWYVSDYDADKDRLTMTQIEGYVPANTAIIVKGTAGESYDFVETSKDVVGVTGNLLSGSVTDYAAKTYTTDDGWYYLATSGNFKKYEGKDIVRKAHKAYLYLADRPWSVSAKELSIDWEPTGIKDIQDTKMNVQGSIYNLNGVRVNENYNGIVIMNGKKYINK